MAVSKRLRMEILRRDNYTCRYCGGSAPDVKLTIDHVTPTALGGTDDPSNLVTACADCNAGKSSVQPDAPLVEDVKQDALRWAAAVKAAAATVERDAERYRLVTSVLGELWECLLTDWRGDPLERPADWAQTIRTFMDAGLPAVDMEEALDITAARAKAIGRGGHWRYFCGICWRKIDKLNEIARGLIATEDTESP